MTPTIDCFVPYISEEHNHTLCQALADSPLSQIITIHTEAEKGAPFIALERNMSTATLSGIASQCNAPYMLLYKDEKRYSVTKILIFMAIAMVLRFLCHFVSGITIWRSFDVYNNPWIYSLVYNVVYMLPEMLICLGAAGLLFSTEKSREFLLSNQ